MKRVWKTGLFMLTILSLLSSCAERKEKLEPLQAGTIKVVYLDEESFYEDYGKYFKLQFPQIDVEVISKSKLITEFNEIEDYKEATRKFLNKYSPDVLLLDEEMKLVTDEVRSGSIILNANGSNKHFMNKEAAMTFGSPNFMLALKHNGIQMNWGIATMPVLPNDESMNIYSREIFAISADSPNKRAAWELVKLVNGAEMAKALSNTYNGTLPSRTGFLKEYDGKSLEAFYMLQVKETAQKWGNDHVPESFFRLFVEPLRTEMQAVIENRKTIDEAAAVLEKAGQKVLMQARAEKPENSIVDRK